MYQFKTFFGALILGVRPWITVNEEHFQLSQFIFKNVLAQSYLLCVYFPAVCVCSRASSWHLRWLWGDGEDKNLLWEGTGHWLQCSRHLYTQSKGKFGVYPCVLVYNAQQLVCQKVSMRVLLWMLDDLYHTMTMFSYMVLSLSFPPCLPPLLSLGMLRVSWRSCSAFYMHWGSWESLEDVPQFCSCCVQPCLSIPPDGKLDSVRADAGDVQG